MSLAIQLIGSLATVLATVFITRTYGPEGQGYLSYFRSTVDLAVSIGTFGLPQAFVYMINSSLLSVGWALRFSRSYSILFALFAACIGAVFYASGAAHVHGFDGIAVGCAVLASAGLLAHGLYRAIALVTSSTGIFNVVTVLPAVLILFFYFIARPANFAVLVFAHVVASLLSVASVMAFLGRKKWPSHSLHGGLSILKYTARYGMWSFVPHVGLTASAVGTYALLRQGAGGVGAVGQFTVGVLVLSAAVLPLNMIIPILFNAWSGGAEELRRTSFIKLAHLGTLFSFLGLTAGVALAEPLTIIILGRDLLPSVAVTQIMLMGIFASYQTRLSSAFLLSLGRADSVAIGAAIRAILIIALLAQGFAESITATAVAWIVGEFAGVGYLLSKIVRMTGWPILTTLGLSPSWAVRELITRRAFERWNP